ncbi:hypothetical protein [Pectobacterium zantedeschiae]|uniref:Uncharacterized protein n=1 Tax=Pectobacterium zantedeschiae TaxID=2034769 RepID=A0A9X8JKB0_9GAMM|nr:hypothetical protein [Pectobacterium zantedeschiae]RYC38664.1 hypothetical protein CTN06_20110 [Pectobacterium zantedeschiae]RYC42071.1 hypothetical protein CTN06_11955 [Pectobacterium zantedeschiae]RYC45308.1 hypothetical protein CLR69_10075 [Pectobacterium zantedeschiae]
MVEKEDIFSTLQQFLDSAYETVAEHDGNVLTKRSGHTVYQSGKFIVYISLFPHEVELIFEGEDAGNRENIITLIACTPDGNVLNDNIFTLCGGLADIKIALESHRARVADELTTLLPF